MNLEFAVAGKANIVHLYTPVHATGNDFGLTLQAEIMAKIFGA